MEKKPFKELDSKQEENLSGGQAVPEVLPNLGLQNALGLSTSGNTTEGGNSNSGSANASNTNSP